MPDDRDPSPLDESRALPRSMPRGLKPAACSRWSGFLSTKGLFAVVVWGASFAATRLALQALHPFGLVAVRLWTGAALLGLLVKLRGGRLWPQRGDLPVCLFLGGVLAVHLLIQAYGLLHTTAIHAGWIIGFIPITIALGAQLLRQQHMTAAGWLGVLAGTGGVLIVMSAKPPDFRNAHWGDLLQVASCVTWAVYTLAGIAPIRRNGVLCVTAFGMAVAAGLATLAGIATGMWRGPLTAQAGLAVAFLGLVCSGAAYYMWFAAQRDHGPTRVGALLYIEPFVALAAGAVLLHEPVTIHAVAGGCCVLTGVWLVARGTRRPGELAPPPVNDPGSPALPASDPVEQRS